MKSRIFAIKADVSGPYSTTFAFKAQKKVYDGKHIAKRDTISVFESENEGGPGLVANGVVTLAKEAAAFLGGFFWRDGFGRWEQKR